MVIPPKPRWSYGAGRFPPSFSISISSLPPFHAGTPKLSAAPPERKVTMPILNVSSAACAAIAVSEARHDVREGRLLPVPRHLRDRHYAGAKRLGHGEGYEYARDALLAQLADDGEEVVAVIQHRYLRLEEAVEALEGAGLELFVVHGGFDQHVYDPDSERMIITARRASSD